MNRRLLAGLLLAAFPVLALADLVVGQTTGLSGPEASAAKDNTEGARLYLDAVNAAGGVHGQKIELVSMDDQSNPKVAADNARKLLTEKNAIALFMTRGTATTQALQPLLKQHKVPLVAPASGAMALREPVDPWLFNVRGTWQREAEKAVEHLTATGVSRIAVVQIDDAFGADAAIGAMRGFDKARLRAAFVMKFKPGLLNLDNLVKGTDKLDIQALVVLAPEKTVVDVTRALRVKGARATVVTISNNASLSLVQQLGPQGRGTIVTQVFPSERSLGTPLVKEAYTLAQAKGNVELTPAMLEGFAGAKVLVEGLRRAGRNPTPQKLRDALEGLGKLNLGGVDLTYSAKDHGGLEYADLSIVGPDGRFQR